jgi:preprotein translocase subunit SecB
MVATSVSLAPYFGAKKGLLMSDTSSTTPPNAGGPTQAQQPQGPALHTMAQYTKDFSFENPSPIESLSQQQNNSNINVTVSVDTAHVRDNAHEVTLGIRVQAMNGEKTLFLVELSYCGLFALVNIPKENQDAVLRIHCPTLLFPFVRQMVAEAVRNGGFPPLYLNMVDFAALYQQQMQGGGAAASTGSSKIIMPS